MNSRDLPLWALPCFLLVFVANAQADDTALSVQVGPEQANASLWLETSLQRVYPQTPPGSSKLELLAARNSTISFQACVRNTSTEMMRIDGRIENLGELKGRTRFVGLVPLPHHTYHTELADLDGVGHVPGLVPDPLLPQTQAMIGPQESRSFWITLQIPTEAAPGTRTLSFRFYLGNDRHEFELPVELQISPFTIEPRRDFHVIHWWRGEATWDWYQTGMFEDERWWELTRQQLEDMLAHGSDVVYVPIFFDRREVFERPCQLLVVEEPSPGDYQFDWSLVKRFTDMARDVGFKKFEWSHLWIYWGVENAVRVYHQVDGQYALLWPEETGAVSETYLNFLRQFLPEFHTFLTKENLLEDSYFHLSDEPGPGQHVENYKRARQVLRELAPWMKVMDALSDIEYGKQGLTDIPIPLVDSAQAYEEAGIPHWVYYCCVPTGRWLNRFLDTPLTKVRMSGWLFYRHRANGFLHWGYNYWHLMAREEIGKPFQDASNGDWPWIPYGDPFVVYPGQDGVVDSLRWEVFAESLQDYAILQTAGIDPDAEMLSDLKTYADFPRSEEWIATRLRAILTAPAQPSAP